MDNERFDWLRTIARRMGISLEEDHIYAHTGCIAENGEGYWLIDVETHEGVGEDENFSTSLEEVEGKLREIAAERDLIWSDGEAA